MNQKPLITPARLKWLVYALLCGSVVLPAIALLSMQREDEALAREGRTTQAQVFYKHIDHVKTTHYVVEYRFTLNGQAYKAQKGTSESYYQKIAEGSPITITYLPSDIRVQRMGRVRRMTQAEVVEDRNLVLIIFGCLALFMTGLIVFLEWVNRPPA